MIRLMHPVCLLCLSAACCIASGAELQADETKVVASRVQAYVKAFNRRDLDACVKHWSDNAEYVLAESGARVHGRKAIRQALQKLLVADEKFELSVSDQRFRQVSEDVVLEEGTATVVSAKHGIERADYVVVHVKQEGKWYRDSVRETRSAAPQTSRSQLSELAWLLGDWRAENDQGSVEIDGKWMNDKRFISRSFKVLGKRRLQVGWHANRRLGPVGCARSAHGVSTRKAVSSRPFGACDGGRWLVKVTAVLPDGSVGSEQRLITHDGNGRMTTEVIEQQVNGQLLPGSDKVTLVRQAKD